MRSWILTLAVSSILCATKQKGLPDDIDINVEVSDIGITVSTHHQPARFLPLLSGLKISDKERLENFTSLRMMSYENTLGFLLSPTIQTIRCLSRTATILLDNLALNKIFAQRLIEKSMSTRYCNSPKERNGIVMDVFSEKEKTAFSTGRNKYVMFDLPFGVTSFPLAFFILTGDNDCYMGQIMVEVEQEGREQQIGTQSTLKDSKVTITHNQHIIRHTISDFKVSRFRIESTKTPRVLFKDFFVVKTDTEYIPVEDDRIVGMLAAKHETSLIGTNEPRVFTRRSGDESAASSRRSSVSCDDDMQSDTLSGKKLTAKLATLIENDEMSEDKTLDDIPADTTQNTTGQGDKVPAQPEEESKSGAGGLSDTTAHTPPTVPPKTEEIVIPDIQTTPMTPSSKEVSESEEESSSPKLPASPTDSTSLYDSDLSDTLTSSDRLTTVTFTTPEEIATFDDFSVSSFLRRKSDDSTIEACTSQAVGRYDIRESAFENDDDSVTSSIRDDTSTKSSPAKESKSLSSPDKKHGAVIALCVTGGIMLILGLIFVFHWYKKKKAKNTTQDKI